MNIQYELKAKRILFSTPVGRSLESVLLFLLGWFLSHVLEQDKKFAAYIR